MTAITLDGVADRVGRQARARRRASPAAARRTASCPDSARSSSATTPVRGRTSRASTATAPRSASSRSASTCPRRRPRPTCAPAIRDLNAAPEVTGYIVQLPLPAGHDENAMLELIDPDKDADGLHPTNLGRLVLGIEGELHSPLPCTPAGIVEMLRRYDVPIAGTARHRRSAAA